MATVAIILAAGAGKRMGADQPKQFLDLGGRSLILYALDAFEACSAVDRIVLVTSPDMIDEVRTLASVCEKVQDVVAGGAERQDSVAEGIKAAGDVEIITVHDGARPMVRAEEIADVIEAARANGAAVIGQPASDTIKRGRDGQVIETLDRSEVWAVQTPQAFKADVIREAHEAAARDGFYGTDDTALVERIGKPVTLVEGSRDNIKVTHPGDLERAEDILNRRMEGGVQRIGMGYDVHHLAEGRKLILGGVEVPFERGLDGHSDADVLSHVVIDALLGAASLGDIGRLFPDTDAAYKDISSLVLLERTAEALREANVTVGNVDATVMAQRPKLAPHIGQMEANIAEALGIDVSQVSVKATTTEKLGFVGEEKGMAAQAIALVSQSAKGKMENENRGGAE
ncbi:MAG: bifunctional 2-C-methyl-D-erythritol 4-phosphate cytidylyltransferase/2-C-methyl-D-erythritol 2,4-cyclodiphosphate synthase [Gemmatimonadetes bacterium]|mgnify:CR=1 FL=1|nr:bifunctional 2-C-methyl-D-erythritol 4-phosphate cytidylyltransferase/2-C-methyl-D-erythritol 2,4-cyclodiphosphate synthase [Gemmatimonadota bacterium]